MGLQVDIRVLDGSTAVLALQGRLDAVTAPSLKSRIQDLVRDGRVDLVCDLSAIDVLDSSGLSALVSGLEVAREHDGSLKVACVGARDAERFKRTGLDHVFDLYPTVEGALRGR